MPKSPAAMPALPPLPATMYELNFDEFPSEDDALNETPNLVFVLFDYFYFAIIQLNDE